MEGEMLCKSFEIIMQKQKIACMHFFREHRMTWNIFYDTLSFVCMGSALFNSMQLLCEIGIGLLAVGPVIERCSISPDTYNGGRFVEESFYFGINTPFGMWFKSLLVWNHRTFWCRHLICKPSWLVDILIFNSMPLKE